MLHLKDILLKKIFNLPVHPSETIKESEELRKRIMLYALTLLGVVFLVMMSFLLVIEESRFYAFLNLCFSVFLIVLFLFVRTGKRLRLYSIVSISCLQVFLMFLFHSGAGNQMVFVWYYLFPLISLFLLGTGLGTFFSLSIIVLSLFVNAFSDHIPIFVHYSGGKMLRIF